MKKWTTSTAHANSSGSTRSSYVTIDNSAGTSQWIVPR